MSIDLTVFNLPPTVTPEQLQAAFEQFGQVEQATIADKDKDRHGYVRMTDEEEAYAAMQSLDGSQVEGQVIRVGQDAEGTKLFLSNLPQTSSAERVEALLSEFGEVMYILHFKRTASVRMQTVSAALAATQKPFEVDGNTIYAVAARSDAKLTPEEQQLARSIADELGETGQIQVRAIKAIVRLCGTAFTQAVLEETRRIEAAGGLMTTRGDRRRTSGGVFFSLARQRLPGATWRQIFPQAKTATVKPNAQTPPNADQAQSRPVEAQDTPKASVRPLADKPSPPKAVPSVTDAATKPSVRAQPGENVAKPTPPVAPKAPSKAEGGVKPQPIPRSDSPMPDLPVPQGTRRVGQASSRTGTQTRGTKKENPATKASPAALVQPTSNGGEKPVERLAQLRVAEQKARERVAAIRRSDGQIGLAKAMSELQAVKNEIAALLKANPHLA